MHAHEVVAEEPEMKLVIKDELFQEFEDIKKSVAAARLIPEYTPDSSHSRRYYPIGIYEPPCP
jgi:hypothetical protein